MGATFLHRVSWPPSARSPWPRPEHSLGPGLEGLLLVRFRYGLKFTKTSSVFALKLEMSSLVLVMFASLSFASSYLYS